MRLVPFTTIARLVLGMVAAAELSVAAAAGLVSASDLGRDAEQAAASGTPILLFFAADSCPYCHEVEELYLEPMLRRGDYAGRLVVRVVDVESSRTLRDFAGRATSHARFARAEGVRFTPTIRLYGPLGRELVAPILGYSSPDFYWGYLAQRIEQSIALLQERGARAVCGAPQPLPATRATTC